MNVEIPEGCRYREHEGESACNKMCDPGQTLCPHHLLLAQVEGKLSVGDAAQPPTLEHKPPQPERVYKTPRAYSE